MSDPLVLLGLAAAALAGAAALVAVDKKQGGTPSADGLDLGGDLDEVTDPAPDGPAEEPGDDGEPDDSEQAAGEPDAGDRQQPLLSRLPGAARRDRRRFAAAGGFDYVKHDDFLAGEFDFPDVPVDMRARDAVSGISHGKEMHLADFGDHTVLAVRRAAASGVVVRFVRTDNVPEAEQPVPVAAAGGFTAWAAEPGPAATFIDVRVRSALGALTARVTEIVVAGQWVAALIDRRDAEETATQAIAPLGLIADAALVLPPLNAGDTPDTTGCDPTRPALLAPQTAARATGALSPATGSSGGQAMAVDDTAEVVDDDGENDFSARTVHRGGLPDEDDGKEIPPSPHRITGPAAAHVDLPTRSVTQRHGTVNLHQIGGDLIEPIADGKNKPAPNPRPRVARHDKAASIFTDTTDPEKDEP